MCPTVDLRRMELATRQAQRWLRQSTTVGAGGARPSHQLWRAIRSGRRSRRGTLRATGVSKPASGLVAGVDGWCDEGRTAHAVKAISLALDMPADPRCMEPDRTRRDRCSKRVQVVANDPEGVVGHSDWPVLGSASTRDEAAMAKARKFGTEQEDGYRAMILDQYAGQGTMCYCDGSYDTVPHRKVRRQASAGQRIDVTGHEVCTGRLQSRQQPSCRVAPRLRGRQWWERLERECLDRRSGLGCRNPAALGLGQRRGRDGGSPHGHRASAVDGPRREMRRHAPGRGWRLVGAVCTGLSV